MLNTKYKILHTIIRRIRLRTWVGLGIIIVLLPIVIFRVIYGVIAAPPVANTRWTFDEAQGATAQDYSANDNDGTVTGASRVEKDRCLDGNCLSFDGADDNITRADDADMDFAAAESFTISLWYRHGPESAGTDVIAVKLEAVGTDGGYIIQEESDGDITCAIEDDDADTTIDDTISSTAANYDDGKWHYIACVKSGTSSLTLYIDGMQVAQDAVLDASSTLANDEAFYLGADNGGTTNEFTGFIDEFRMYRSALTAAEILVDFNFGASARFKEQPSDFLTEALVAYYPWENNGTTTVLDSSGNGNSLAETNGVADGNGKFRYAGNFELSTAEYASVADNASLSITGSLTLSAWINPETITAGSYNIIAKWDGANESYRLFQNGDEIRLELDSADNYQETTAINLAAGTLYHVVGVYDASTATAKIYVNGVEIASTTTGTIPSSIGDDGGKFHLGGEDSTGGATGYYDGLIDEARVYSRAFSPSEVKSLYEWAPGPALYLPFDENTGTTNTFDRSGNGVTFTFDATMTEDDWVEGKFGSALEFDNAITDHIFSSTLVATSPSTIEATLTVSAWIKRLGNDTEGIILSKANGSCINYHLSSPAGASTGVLAFEYANFGTQQTFTSTSAPLTNNTWVYVAVTYTFGTPSTMHMYANGVEIAGSWTGGDGTDTTCVGDAELSMGAPQNNPFNMQLDELRIYNYARTQQQIIEDMNGGHASGGSPISSQAGYWKMDEMTGTTANDLGLNANADGTLTNSPTWTTSGKVNAALDFESGSSQYVTVTNISNVNFTGDFSLSAWIKPESNTAATEYPIATRGTSYALVQYGDEVRAYIGSTSNYETTDVANLQTGTWYHVTAAYDASAQTVIIYVNGNEAASTTTGTIPASLGANGSAFDIGRMAYETSVEVSASADDARQSGAAVVITDTTLESDATTEILGFRFNSIAVNQAQTVQTASLAYWVTATGTDEPDHPITGDDSDDCAIFTAGAANNDISVRADTTATVTWSSTNLGAPGTFNTGTVATIAQEIIDRAGWTSGSDICFVVTGSAVGTRDLTVAAQDHATLQAPFFNYSTTAPTYYDGLIDEVQAYSGTLTAAEAKVVANAGSNAAFGVLATTSEEADVAGSQGTAPVAYHPMDENTSTTANDKSGSSNNGTLQNTATWTPGKYGSAVVFDGNETGNDTSILLTDDAYNALTEGTVEMWFKPSDAGDDWQNMFGMFGGGDGANQWELSYELSTNRVHLWSNGCATSVQAYAALSDPQTGWHHLAVTSNSSGNKMYLDGVLQTLTYTTGSASTDCFFDDTVNVTAKYHLGCISTGGTSACFSGELYQGALDEFKIYNYARSAAQVAYDFNRGGPLAWYKIDDCTDTTVNDLSLRADLGSAIDGTWSGAGGGNTSQGTCAAVDANTAWYNGRNGKYGSSLDFDGTDDAVLVTNSNPIDLNVGLTTGFTFSTWVYPNSDGETDVGEIFDKGTDTYCRTDTESASRVDIECRIDLTTDAAFNISSAIPINQWSHVAFSWTNDADDEVTIWINGIANTSSATFSGDPAADANNLTIGGTPNFDGQIDDFRIFNYELTAAQMRKVMNEGSGARFGPATGTP